VRRTRRARIRALWLGIVGCIFGLALVLFPLKVRGAAAERTTSAPADKPHADKPHAEKTPVDKGAAKAATPAPATSAAIEGAPATTADATSIPLGKGLPVRVNVGVYFLEIESFDDTKGEYTATIDVRNSWYDTRLAFEKAETLRGYREFIGKAAEERLGAMWAPNIDAKNRTETAGYVGRRLRIFPDGRVETITRSTGKYKVHVDASSFPFDRQRLSVELITRDDTMDTVRPRFDEHDVAFSRAANTATLDGWDIGLVDLARSAVAGWNGDRYGTITATLFVERKPASSIASVFIPLLASLLIPLLALWMNRATEDGFEVDAFELANMGIGGLFSVIALSFAIYSSNPVIASSDNTVTRLFGLNYATLAVSLAIVVTFFRYELPKRWFGAYVQEELFHFLSWAIPLVSFATSIAFLFVAAA